LLTIVSDWLKQAEPGDTVFVYFSGHGFPDKEGQHFLALLDTERAKLTQSGLRTDNLRDVLRQCEASQKLLVLDCCHAGTGRGEASAGPSSEEIAAAFRKAAGLITLASCGREQKSREWSQVGHGLFTYYLAKGLQGGAERDGDGIVDSDELYRYTLDEVRAASLRVFGKPQEPRRIIPGDTVGSFPLARVAPAPTPPVLPRETRTAVTATFTVREVDENGPRLSGATLELLWREKWGSETVVLGRATSDTEGLAAISAWLDAKQQAKGDFLVLISSTAQWAILNCATFVFGFFCGSGLRLCYVAGASRRDSMHAGWDWWEAEERG